MNVRFGYVAMSVQLKNASPSQTMTVKQFEQIKDREAGLRKLERIAIANLQNCLRLLKHNAAHDITFFRLSSKLVPLVNHDLTEGWNYEKQLLPYLKEIATFIKKYNMRVGFHPDHFVVLNNLDEELLKRSLQTLVYHYKLLKGMDIDPTHRCVLHVGGAKKGKIDGLEDFVENFTKVPRPIQKMLILENDDTVFHIEDVLYLGEKLQIPVVFDLHHHDVNPPEEMEDFLKVWERIVATWQSSTLPMKVHISSPKETKEDKRHHDYINSEKLISFLNQVKGTVERLDIMIEAKKKDAALFKLMNNLKSWEGCALTSKASIKLLD